VGSLLPDDVGILIIARSRSVLCRVRQYIDDVLSSALKGAIRSTDTSVKTGVTIRELVLSNEIASPSITCGLLPSQWCRLHLSVLLSSALRGRSRAALTRATGAHSPGGAAHVRAAGAHSTGELLSSELRGRTLRHGIRPPHGGVPHLQSRIGFCLTGGIIVVDRRSLDRVDAQIQDTRLLHQGLRCICTL
jgi:hypothetical protein